MTDKDDLDRLIRAAWCCAAANIDDLRTAAADARNGATDLQPDTSDPEHLAADLSIIDSLTAAAELLDLLAVYRTVQSWTTDSPVIDLLDDDIDSDTNNHH